MACEREDGGIHVGATHIAGESSTLETGQRLGGGGETGEKGKRVGGEETGERWREDRMRKRTGGGGGGGGGRENVERMGGGKYMHQVFMVLQ